ncbi:TetR/AcrR family transcriptional regulator [Actinoplanes sp. NPDC051859]|uniref:TetR/AcrR family transcriptional regulator n=1 Tax=Actinoplanes sp. NPDC051859 TaxID=3363909 RepID=UPI0037A08197
MPKVVDHGARRRELAAAVSRVIARDGVTEVSIRTVAAESGWSSGALRHYFATRAELLAFACEEVVATVTQRIEAIQPAGTVREAAEVLLRETMPLDERRHLESSIAFAFLALSLNDPELARVQRLHFTAMAGFCLDLIKALLPGATEQERAARRLHTVVDGLTVHILAGHLTPAEAAADLTAYLDDLMAP